MNKFKITMVRLLVIALTIIASASAAFGDDTGWLNASCDPTDNTRIVGTGFETHPEGACDEGPPIALDARSNNQGNNLDSHAYWGFDLSTLPDSATITGIQVFLRALATGNTPQMNVSISKTGIGGFLAPRTANLTNTFDDYYLPGESVTNDLWGLGVTRGADLKTSLDPLDPNNKFVIKIENSNNAANAQEWQLQWLRVRIYYDYVADLTIDKTHPGYPTGFTQGSTGAYQIDVGNTGTGATLGTVTVTDTLPSGLIATDMGGTGWTCDLPTLTCTRGGPGDELAAGLSYDPITLTVDVTTEASPTLTNTAVVSGGGEIYTANNTDTDVINVIQLVPNLIVAKSVEDENGGNLKVSDTLLYTVVIRNPTGGYLTGAEFTDDLPANTTYIDDSATAPAGTAVSFTDNASPTPDRLAITGINVPAHGQISISFRVTVIGTGPTNDVINQGSVAFDTDGDGANDGTQLTDGDTTTPDIYEETIIPVSTEADPNFSQTTKSVDLLAEALPIDGAFSPGDTLRYTIVIPNTGDAPASGVTFTDAIPADTTYVPGSVTANRGTPTYLLNQIEWSDANPINIGESVTITFDVEINTGVGVGTVISNQGTVTYNAVDTLTDSDLSIPGKQPTDVTIGGIPRIKAVKSVTDENGGHLVPGDILLYTIEIDNLSAYAVSGIRFTDGIPGHTAYVDGSATTTSGSITLPVTTPLEVTGIGLPAYGQQTITFKVTVDDPLAPGVTQISNQGTVFFDIDGDGTNDTTQLTDGDSTRPGNQFTIISLGTAPNFEQTTKSAALRFDADANEILTAGDTVRYNVKIRNTGSLDATGVVFTDPLPSDVAFVAIVSPPEATYNIPLNQVEWTGDVAIGTTAVIEFDVTINGGTPTGTVISNQGTVTWNLIDTLTDGDYTTLAKDPTVFTVGGFPHGYGTKTATDVNGGNLEPGDTVLYTITVYNTSGFYGSGQEFFDTIPANTSYVPGSAVAPPGATIVTTTPTLYIKGISVAPYGNYTITFSVRVDNPLPDGVTQISNQAEVFYDTNTDGTNDTYQSTDGDPAAPGNQPTVSIIYGSTISGTVFEDTDESGSKEAGEPGIDGVTVELLDEFFTLLYGTTTDIDGYYKFTLLAPGNYVVRETDPAGYVSTTPNIVTITGLATSAEANFGNRVFSGPGADLQIDKTCATLYPGGQLQQLVCRITILNNGPAEATGVELTDVFTALIAAGLSNPRYTADGLLPSVDWTGSLLLGDMASGTSHTVRIFADVADTFTPVENTALVASDNDPFSGNNSVSCTNAIAREGRYALDVITGPDVYMTALGENIPGLGTTGTMEAWIYPTEFIADAGVIMKGTSLAGACYGFGFGGGTGGVFTDGTPQNIGFVLFDDNGDKHLFTGATALTANKWHHVACVWDLASSPQMAIYINGIQETGASPIIPGGRLVRVTNETVFVGIQAITPMGFPGVIDEVRIWSLARTPAQIRTTLCRKVYSSDAGFDHLEGYWRFDEDGGLICGDASGNGRIGVLTNAQRICSSAPIGDDSAFDYDTPFTVTLDYDSLDEMTVTEDGGTWDASLDSCVHVYRVDGPPNYTSSNSLLGKSLADAQRYWGVFKAGGTDPTYTMVYHYDGYPDISNESSLQMNYRNHNCDQWKGLNATLSTTNKTLTKTRLSGTEFILGTDMDPRNAIDFDGSNDYVDVADDTSLDLTTDGTLEAWIYISSAKTGGIIHRVDTSGANPDGYFLGINASGNVLFSLYESGGPSTRTVTSSTALSPGIWYHIAGTWDDGDLMHLYINGVPDGSSPSAQISGTPTTSTHLAIGTGNTNFFQGAIDEVRVWNTARSQTAIRDTMCKKITSSETGFASLMGYWRFDEETGSANCPDLSNNTNTGIMTGFTTGAYPIEDARICSSAPIGDDSAYGYYDGGTLSPVTAQLPHPDGDYLFAAEYSGDWGTTFSGLQIYRLDEAPIYPPDLWNDPPYSYATPSNGLTPPPNWSSIDYYRYWGVFATDWAPGLTYDVIYNYGTVGNGNPNVPAAANPNDPTTPQIDLAKRDAYCDRSWAATDANWDTSTMQLELLGTNAPPQDQSQNGPPKTNPEYILGGINQPLAIALASFTAKVVDGCIVIFWETATEIDTLGFQLWRSTEKGGPYAPVSGGFIASNSRMETLGASYDYTDCDVETGGKTEYFYKLEEIDMDSGKDNAFYGPIGPVREGMTASQTAPRNKSNDNGACFIGALQ